MYTPAALLDGAIKKLTDEKGEIIVSTFFDGTEALAIEGNRLIIKVDTDLTCSILQQRFDLGPGILLNARGNFFNSIHVVCYRLS